MVIVKLLKNRSYFCRFQTKRRRRREGKTDYRARKALVSQDKDKYDTVKKRLIVRITSTRVIAQVAYATLAGDRVIEGADSTELKRFGITWGLTNYAAAYATGLLLARRLLAKLKLGEKFPGTTSGGGEQFEQDVVDGDRPLTCYLDVGIVRTTRGNKVFAAMKGAADGGLRIPYNMKRFPGYDPETNEFDAQALRDRIFGVHVVNYMKILRETEPDRYQLQFSKFIKDGVNPDTMEEMYQKAHEGIRLNPMRPCRPEKTPPTRTRKGNLIVTPSGQYIRLKKLTREQRKARVAEKIRLIAEAVAE